MSIIFNFQEEACPEPCCIRHFNHAGKHRIMWGPDGPLPRKKDPEHEIWIPPPPLPEGITDIEWFRKRLFEAIKDFSPWGAWAKDKRAEADVSEDNNRSVALVKLGDEEK